MPQSPAHPFRPASRRAGNACIVLVLALVVVPGAAVAFDEAAPASGTKATTTIVASGGDTYSPFHFIADGQPRGFDVDLLEAVCRAVGLDCRIRLMPWRDARDAMTDGSVQVHVGMTISPERREEFRFTSPHLDQQYRIFVRQDRRDIADADDLVGRRIIVQSKGVMEQLVVERGYTTDPLTAANAAEALRMLAAGEGDACLMSELRGLHVARELGFDNLARVGEPVFQTFYGFAVPPRNEDLIPRLNQGLAIVKASGEYDRIYDRWLGVLADSHPGRSDYLRWTARIAVPLLAAALLALLWSWSLRRQVARQTVALEKARDLAEQASEAKSRFLAAMSHEIRTPLNGVLGMSHLLMGSGLSEDQVDQVETIRKSARALQEIITDILDFSRIEAGERILECIPFPLAELLNDTLDIMRPMALRKGIELRGGGLSELPPMVTGDPTAVRQVLLNLLGNAVKFTDQGYVDLRVLSENLPDGNLAVTFAVEDTGIGIDPAQTEHLFHAFTQADSSTTRRFGGTGLGLAICSNLVGLMDGTIDAEAREGGGSVFRFRLVFGPGGATPVAEAVPDQSGLTPWTPHGLHILLVEDNPLNQHVMRLLMRKYGIRMTLAEDGRQALDTWRETPFDAVLMDCQMPVMDGFEATAEMRRIEAETGASPTPVIALTAGAFKSDRDRCLAVGMDDYLTKPIDGDLLLRALERWTTRPEPVPTA